MIRIWNSYFTCIRTYKNLSLDLQFKTNSHIGDTYEHFVLYAGIENRYQNLQYLHMWLINWVRYINIQTFLLNKTSSVMLSTYIVKKLATIWQRSVQFRRGMYLWIKKVSIICQLKVFVFAPVFRNVGYILLLSINSNSRGYIILVMHALEVVDL